MTSEKTIHCLSLMSILITRLTDFAVLQHILPGASASCAPTPVDYTNRLQGFLDLVLPTYTRWSSSPTIADTRIKCLSRRSILLHSNDIAQLAQPLDINMLHDFYAVEELIQLTVESNAVVDHDDDNYPVMFEEWQCFNC